jgi:hypothetical protein
MKVYQWFIGPQILNFVEKSQSVPGATKQSYPPCTLSLGGPGSDQTY